jgi:predicted RNase H-like HicB family nuclease
MFIPHMVEGIQVYDVLFPDLPGCFSQGDSLEQAWESAAEALHCHLGTDDPTAWPAASPQEQAMAKAKEEHNPLPAGVRFLLVEAPADITRTRGGDPLAS